ncbi:MAG: diguanylate cyclase [Burkholderiales bacterium]|nr:diguanylate cyclase [Burkholderiales bacterium]
MGVLTNPTDLARETLKLLAARRIAPTPENFTRLYHEIAGTRPAREAPEDRAAHAIRQAADAYPALTVLQRLARALEERDYTQFSSALVGLAGGKESGVRHEWGLLIKDLLRHLDMRQTGTGYARKREAVERVLIGFSSDAQLFGKLEALHRSWGEASDVMATPQVDFARAAMATGEFNAALDATAPPASMSAAVGTVRQLKDLLAQTLEIGLAARLERFPPLAEEARKLAHIAREGNGSDVWGKFGTLLRQFFFRVEVRGEADAELLDGMLRLVGFLLNNIEELVDDDQWLSGQLKIVREVIQEPLTTDKINEAERRFKEVIYKQSTLKHSLEEAKGSLKTLISTFVERLTEVSATTSEYHEKVSGYLGRVENANDVGSLKDIVDELMSDTRAMQVDMLRYRDDMVHARRQAEQAESKVRRLEAELEHVSEQVSQDQLTGTLNRRGLEEAMQREMARAERSQKPLSVAILDLDNFKQLNDTYGHQAGDDALVHLTKVIRKTLRPTDIVARYGGEEFVVLFGETPLAQAVEVTKRLQRELTRRFFLHNNERLLITFSAGVSTWRPGDSQEIAFARADKAMYQAKLQGKNRVVVAE